MSSLCLLTVHAHPDDEASKGAGTVARYHAEGVHTVLVTCTGGEEGDILNPAMDQSRDPRPPCRGAPAGTRSGRRDHRLRRGRHAGLPGLGDAGQPRQLRPAELRGRAPRRSGRAPGGGHPAYPAPGRRHLPTGPDGAIPIRTTCGSTRSRSWPSTPPATLIASRGPGRPGSRCGSATSSGRCARMRAMHEKYLELGLESPYEDERLARCSKAETRASQAPGTDAAGTTAPCRVDIQRLRLGHAGVPAGPRHPGGPHLPPLVRPAQRGGRRPCTLTTSTRSPATSPATELSADLFAGRRHRSTLSERRWTAVPEWLSEEWLKEVASAGCLPAAPRGLTGTVSVAVSGRPQGEEVAYHWSYQDGAPGDGGTGPVPDADLALDDRRDDARSVCRRARSSRAWHTCGAGSRPPGTGPCLLGLAGVHRHRGLPEWRQHAMDLAEPA